MGVWVAEAHALKGFLIALVGIGAILLGCFFGKKVLDKKKRQSHFMAPFQHLNGSRVWLSSLGWAWIADGIDILTIGLCLKAVALDTTPITWIMVFLAINIAILVPLTPGNLGTLEAGAVFALSELNVNQERALAFAFTYHAVQIIPIALVGTIALIREFNPAFIQRNQIRNSNKLE
jgi:uncharacterized membrane protein YbhN (UPF0104 family)